MDAPREGETRSRLGSPGRQPGCSAKASQSCLAADPERALAEERLLIGRPSPNALHHPRAPLCDPLAVPLAERPDRPVAYFDLNKSI